MATHYSPKIATDGLVLCLDAGDKNSYPGSGTTWYDLAGSNNGTLTNGPTFNSANLGYFIFDGSNDYVNFTGYSQPAYGTTTSFTWCVWVYATANDTPPVLGNRGDDLVFTKLTTAGFEYYDDNMTYAMPLNVWQNICVVKNGTSFSYYKNNSVVATQTSSITKVSKPFNIGGDSLASEYSTARISNVLIYDKALSTSEREQNFNAHRHRFGV